MNKIIRLSVIFLFVAGAGFGADGPAIMIRGGLFGPSDHDFRTIYGAGATWGLEASFPLGHHLEPWLSADLFTKHGHMNPTLERTRIWLIPVAAGLRYVTRVGAVDLYGGAGAVWHDFKERAPIGTVTDNRFGPVVEAGGRMPLSGSWEIGLVLRYSYCRMQPAELAFDVGGFRLALGMGYRFR